MGLLEKLFGDASDRELKKAERAADAVIALEAEYGALSDDALRAKTDAFRERLANGETLDDILVEAFATAREAAWRVVGMKPFRVQLIGAYILHGGNIAEMKTGEGKTLVAPIAAYLNAIGGEGVHIVTVNDYLAKRDRDWMGRIFEFLGLTCAVVTHDVTGPERHEAYMADVTYGTNNEFGFDYLRDNMAVRKEQLIQRELNFAIVDEVDSILIDEARTPLIISGMGGKADTMYETANRFAQTMVEDVDFTKDEKDRTVSLTEAGIAKIERHFHLENYSDPENMELNHYIRAALKAINLMKRDVNYIVKDGEIVIVDEFTGRLMFGRRFSEGLHQAIEAKEHVKVREESKTLATITLQNYFRMYKKLAGMTGTAKTEEDEFREIYNMNVAVIPTNKPVIREDLNDAIFSNEKAKFRAIIDEVVRRHETGQPVLVGTISIEKSELLSDMLRRRGIPHNVLNAKNHEREAEIVANAGQFGAVTIATNMAGRGTDIVLGEGVREVGGLAIIGSERHESRRIDNQLRGRAGRQGDPGCSQFFVAMDDDLMRLFGGDRAQGLMARFGLEDSVPIQAGMLSRSIETAQKRVEGRNFSIRKSVLGYDDVMNKQRTIIYGERRRVLDGEDLTDHIDAMLRTIVEGEVQSATADGTYPEEWDITRLETNLREIWRGFPSYAYSDEEWKTMTPERLLEDTLETFEREKDAKEQLIGSAVFRDFERNILLRVVDMKWMDHIDDMDQLRRGIGLRALGQQDPVAAYAKDGFDMFDAMVASIQEDTVKYIYGVTIETKVDRRSAAAPSGIRVSKAEAGSMSQLAAQGSASLPDSQPQSVPLPPANAASSAPSAEKMLRGQMPKEAPKEIRTASHTPVVRKDVKVGRNDSCPCGSGKKYKNCHGRNAND